MRTLTRPTRIRRLLAAMALPLLLLVPTAAPAAADGATLTVDDVAVTEGNLANMQALFTLRLSEPVNSLLVVEYTTRPPAQSFPRFPTAPLRTLPTGPLTLGPIGGTSCASGIDFVHATGDVVFSPGEVAQQVLVTVCGDRTDEPNETFSLRVTKTSVVLDPEVGPSDFPMTGDLIGTATIVDND
jgi:hypothetical protein